MDVCWYFYRFDYDRFLLLRPSLRSATIPAAFAGLTDSPETQAVVDALMEGAMSIPEARIAFMQAACFLGDPLDFDKGLPRCIASLHRQRGREDAAELLGELLAGGKNMEPWLKPSGLTGILTPEETLTVAHAYETAGTGARNQGRAYRIGGSRVRRGGLVGAIFGFAATLFGRTPQKEEMLRLIGDLAREAATNGEGIIVVATR